MMLPPNQQQKEEMKPLCTILPILDLLQATQINVSTRTNMQTAQVTAKSLKGFK